MIVFENWEAKYLSGNFSHFSVTVIVQSENSSVKKEGLISVHSSKHSKGKGP